MDSSHVSAGDGGAQSGGIGLLIPKRPSGLVDGQSSGLTVGEGESVSQKRILNIP